MSLGRGIQTLRKIRKMTRSVFAKRVGISYTSLGELERDETFVRRSTLDSMAKELGVSVDVIYLYSIDLGIVLDVDIDGANVLLGGLYGLSNKKYSLKPLRWNR